MISITIYDTSSGSPLRSVSVSDELMIEEQISDGEGYIVGQFPLDGGFVADGAFVPFPTPRPGPWAVFDIDTLSWTDTRTPADLEAEWIAARQGVVLTRAEFLLAAVGAGLIAHDDALDAARGVVPPAFEAMFSLLPDEQQLEMSIRWGAATVIGRLDPMILGLAELMMVGAEQLDALFGISTP